MKDENGRQNVTHSELFQKQWPKKKLPLHAGIYWNK